MRKIVLIGNPLLRKKSKPVKRVDKYILKLIKEMEEVLDKSEIPGVGLSAPQIGELLRVLIYKEDGKVKSIINPKILKREGKITFEEGCLSIPGVYGDVERAERIVVEGSSKTGKKVKFTKEGLSAVIIQHEIDHLDGILFIDRVKDVKSLRVEEGFDIPEEILKKV